MMGGLDAWDIMMCLRPNMIDNITDRLSETFARQPQPVQTHYNVRMLVMKAALFRYPYFAILVTIFGGNYCYYYECQCMAMYL